MVDAVDIDIIDIEMQITIRFFENGIDEFDFRHLLSGCCIVGNILNRHAPPDDVLCTPDAICNIVHGIFSKRDGHEVIEMTIICAITQVFAVTTDVMGIQKLPDLVQKCLIQRCGTTQIQRETMTDNGNLFSYCPEQMTVTATDIDPVLRGHFHEIDLGRKLICKRAYKGPPQTQTGTCYWIFAVVQVHDAELKCCRRFCAYLFSPHLPSPHLPSCVFLFSPHLPSPHLPSAEVSLFSPHLPSPSFSSPHLPSASFSSPQLPSSATM